MAQLHQTIDDDGCFVVTARSPSGREFQAADPNAVIAFMKLAMTMADAITGDACPDPGKHPVYVSADGERRLLADDEAPSP